MTGVEKLFIYWLERYNLGPGRQIQQIYRPGSQRGTSHRDTWTGCIHIFTFWLIECLQLNGIFVTT